MADELGFPRCIGARVGRGAHVLQGLYGIDTAILVYWPALQPGQYQMLQHHAGDVVTLKHVFVGENVDMCWIQLLGVSDEVSGGLDANPVLAMQNPDQPMPQEGFDQPPQDFYPDHPMPLYPPYPPEFPMPQAVASSVSGVSSMSTNFPPPPPWYPPWQPPQMYREPVASSRSRTTRAASIASAVSSTAYLPKPRMSPETPSPSPVSTVLKTPLSSGVLPMKRPVSSQASSSHRPTTVARMQYGGSSSSTNNPHAVTPPVHVPLLPIETDSDTDSNATRIAEEEQREFEFYATKGVKDALTYWQKVMLEDPLFFLGSADTEEGLACRAFLAEHHDEHSQEKGELSAAQVRAMWPAVSAAVRKELLSFVENSAFRIVPAGTTKNCMSSRWVLTWKYDPITKLTGIKARLTVRGFLDRDSPTLEVFAGTASRWAQRLIVAISVQQGWKLLTADVGSAFLKGLTFAQLAELTGEKVRRAAFLPPVGYESFVAELPNCQHFCKLKHELEMLKAIYGLKDAPRAWRKRLHLALVKLRAEQLRTDTNVYIWRASDGKLLAICSTHVDDLKFGGFPDLLDHLLKELSAQFGVLKICRDSFEHCGIMHELQSDGSYWLHQNHFAQRLQTVDMSAVPITTPKALLSPALVAVYMSALGSVAWLNQTRMDISIYVQALQRNAKSPTVAHMSRLSCVIKWVKRKSMHLCYKPIPSGWLKLLVCSDAAFRREDTTGLAMRGSIIALAEDRGADPGGICNVVDFFARRQRRVVRSTFGAETHSLADGVEVGKLIACTLAEILVPNSTAGSLMRLEETGLLPICLQAITDCRSLFDALKAEETQVPSESSLIMILLQLKELLRTGTLSSLVWCDTRDMVADALNKGSIARQAIMTFSREGVWELQHAVSIHKETHRTAIVSSAVDAKM